MKDYKTNKLLDTINEELKQVIKEHTKTTLLLDDPENDEYELYLIHEGLTYLDGVKDGYIKTIAMINKIYPE